MNTRHLASALLSAILLGQGCADPRVAGNSSETENTIAAREIWVDSVLSIFERPMWGATVATLRLDSTNFDFSHTGYAGRDLVVEQLDGSSVPFGIVVWDKPAARGRLQVRIDSNLLFHGARFRLKWNAPEADRADPVAVWRNIPEMQKVALTSVLVDDFERGSLRNRLPDTTYWYGSASAQASYSGPTLAAAGMGRQGKAMKLDYAVNAAGHYAQIGTTLGLKPYNLRSLDSLVVWVRGSGSLSIAFDYLVPGKDAKAWVHFEMDSVWQRIRICPADFLRADGVGGNVGWDNVRDQVTNLSFLVSGGSQLWIDDVRLYGVNRDDFR